jgi:hypothetical protein
MVWNQHVYKHISLYRLSVVYCVSHVYVVEYWKLLDHTLHSEYRTSWKNINQTLSSNVHIYFTIMHGRADINPSFYPAVRKSQVTWPEWRYVIGWAAILSGHYPAIIPSSTCSSWSGPETGTYMWESYQHATRSTGAYHGEGSKMKTADPREKSVSWVCAAAAHILYIETCFFNDCFM